MKEKIKQNSGISMVSLVITIIVIIILAAIVFIGSRNTVKEAGFSKYASGIADLHDVIEVEYTNLSGQLVAERENYREREIYYMVATGERLDNVSEIKIAGKVSDLLGIKPKPLEGTEYYEITDEKRINAMKKAGQYDDEQKYFVTNKGEVFALPGHDMTKEDNNKWYINGEKYYESMDSIEFGRDNSKDDNIFEENVPLEPEKPIIEYKITKGDGQTINPITANELIFHANMNLTNVKGIKIDDIVVSSSNYVLYDNTVISFNVDYIRTLLIGTHIIEVLTDVNSVKATFKAIDGWQIPEESTYTTKSGLIYNAGEIIKDAAKEGDVLITSDYKYTCLSYNTWNVKVLDNTKDRYGTILESINGKPITHMTETFWKCTNFTTAPAIPSSVTNMRYTFFKCTSLSDVSKLVIPSGVVDMYYTFENCTSLTTLPVISNGAKGINATFKGCTSIVDLSNYIIPESLTNLCNMFRECTSLVVAPIIPSTVEYMDATFYGCTKLITAPVIPSSVTSMSGTFNSCISLSGNIEINATPIAYSYCFSNVRNPIKIVGSCGNKAELAATDGNKYVKW